MLTPRRAGTSDHGRHDLPWRADPRPLGDPRVRGDAPPDPGARVGRVATTTSSARFPTPAAMADAGPGRGDRGVGTTRLPAPGAAAVRRRGRDRATDGWPDDLTELPGVGRYTAAAIVAQADDADVAADRGEHPPRRRTGVGRRGSPTAPPSRRRCAIGRPLRGRDRLLALMDVGALLCRPRDPRCGECPLRRRARRAARSPTRRAHRQAPFAGSFRQRRGAVMARLRAGQCP